MSYILICNSHKLLIMDFSTSESTEVLVIETSDRYLKWRRRSVILRCDQANARSLLLPNPNTAPIYTNTPPRITLSFPEQSIRNYSLKKFFYACQISTQHTPVALVLTLLVPLEPDPNSGLKTCFLLQMPVEVDLFLVVL